MNNEIHFSNSEQQKQNSFPSNHLDTNTIIIPDSTTPHRKPELTKQFHPVPASFTG